MTVNLTPAESPYNMTADQFTDILNLKPDLILVCGGSGNLVLNLPEISSLPSGQGEVQVQVADNLVDLTINCAGSDTFGSAFVSFRNSASFSIPNTSKGVILTIKASVDNMWSVN